MPGMRRVLRQDVKSRVMRCMYKNCDQKNGGVLAPYCTNFVAGHAQGCCSLAAEGSIVHWLEVAPC